MTPKIAIVHDALPFYGGAERTLAAMLRAFPGAPVFTPVHNAAALTGTPLAGADVRTSWLNRLPGIHANHYRWFPLFPLAMRSFDLRGYDVILSSHYAAAHAVRTHGGQVHLCYTYTPLRVLWQGRAAFLAGLPGGTRLPAKAGLGLLRRWDVRAAARVDAFAAISGWIARQVRAAYGREARVIYPPVEVERFTGEREAGDFFVCVSRLARHKKVELVVAAFTQLGLPLQIIGDGPERARLERAAGANVTFRGWLPDEEVAAALRRARALVHMAAEDFGIGLVEAQAAGCPVIAYAGGGNLETVVAGETGLLVAEQTADALAAAVGECLGRGASFDPAALRANAARFGGGRFEEEARGWVEEARKKLAMV